MKTILLFALSLLLSLSVSDVCAQERVYDISQFGLKANSKKNASPVVRKAIAKIKAECRDGEKVILRFPAGRYNFHEAGSTVREYYISNHDQDNPKKVGIALEDMKNLTIDGCTFTNCGGINYAIDLNLVAVQDAMISITNTRFEGNCGASGPIKVAERGTGDGTEADDITGARASVKSLTISGCTFNNSNPILGGDIVLGVTTKTGEKDGNDTGSFPVTIADNKTTKEDKQLKIKLAYTDDSARDITTDIGSAVVGDGTTDPAQGFTITATAGEGGAITPSGRVAVANGGSQTFTVTADSGYSISDVTVDDSTAADVVQNDNGTYTVQNVTKDCTIHATFSKSSSSGGSSSSSTRYTVSVEDTDNGSVKVSPTRASRGTTVTITVKPDEGYELDKLTVTGKDGDSIKLTDKGDGKYTFQMPASKVEVEAVFTAIETEPEQPESLPFTDVSSGEWYYDAVAYVYEKGLMDGTSAVTFDPGAVLTRAMTAQVLWNLAGSPAAPGGAGFTDVAAGAWYNNAISTMANAGILDGYEDGSFHPNGYITRAEFATIAVRFFDLSYQGEDLFPDIDGHWAQDYINQAADAGIIEGYPDGTFGPQKQITRAEAVTMVNRTLDRHPDPDHFLKDMLVWPDNLDTEAWYYADMQEATNSHEYQMKKDAQGNEYEVWTKILPIRDWEALEKEWSDANSSENPGDVAG